MNTETCYHCGLQNPRKPYSLDIFGEKKYFCCVGCQSAAKTIIDSGLGEYYRFHLPDQRPIEALSSQITSAFTAYDQTDVQSEFVFENDDQQNECILLIDGISCSACTWLIEKRLLQLPGVTSATVNAGTHRLSLKWQSQKTPLSEIFQSMYVIGYKASPFLPDQEELSRLRTQRQFILRLGVAGIGMMQAMMNAVALYSGIITKQHEIWLWWTSLFLTLPVIAISAWPFFTSAWHSIRGKQLSMDVSVSLAILSAFAASCYATITGHGEVYFESVNMFTFFLVLSRFLEFRARTMASAQGNAITQSLPQTCHLVTNDAIVESSVKNIHQGDILKILPGETCPIDGIVIFGSTEFDESSFTGEFRTVEKRPGDSVSAGTINQSQAINVQVSKTGANNSFNLLRRLIERASSEKPRIAELADKGSRQFIWSTILISLLIGLVWLVVDPSRAYWIVVSVLVVTCPCALSLATPTALAQATLSLKRKGFVITRGYVLERLAELETIAFDKTGTLTEGQFKISQVQLTDKAIELDLAVDDILSICIELEQESEHSIANAFKALVLTSSTEFFNVVNLPSKGVKGDNEMGSWFLGSPTFDELAQLAGNGTWLTLSLNQRPIAYIELDDQVRPTVPALFQMLKELNIKTHVLTGDPSRVGNEKLRANGLTGGYSDSCSAQDKVDWVKAQEANKIAVIGDGMNDAPVLAQASTSIAMSNATDMTKAQADVLMLTTDLQVIGLAIRTAKLTKKIIRQNLTWALVYNAIALPIAAFGWVTPWQAAIGMSLSSLLVVGNALRLRK